MLDFLFNFNLFEFSTAFVLKWIRERGRKKKKKKKKGGGGGEEEVKLIFILNFVMFLFCDIVLFCYSLYTSCFINVISFHLLILTNNVKQRK